MQRKIVLISVLAAVAVTVFVAAAVLLTQSGGAPQKSATTAVNGTHTQVFGVAGSQNYSAMRVAFEHGVRYFRVDIGFSNGTRSYINGLSANGANMLGILDYNTVGAQASPNGCVSGCNWTLSDWNASVKNAIEEYPNITTWEIWNEPTIVNYVSGYENASPYNYYQMIRSAYIIIKAAEPNSTVVCFGGANLFPYGQQTFEWYSQVWRYGASDYCDAISLHAYSGFAFLLNQTPSGYNQDVGQIWSSTINGYENLTHKPIWITEVGIPSNDWSQYVSLSPQVQAEFLNQSFTLFSSYPFIKRVYWFQLWSGQSPQRDFGLLNATFGPNPSWNAFMDFYNSSASVR